LESVKGFRGLLFEPSYENEVVLLFGLLTPYLRDNFVIDYFSGSFPDCLMIRNGERIGVEFEVLASDFYAHKHNRDPNLPKCKMVVCWRNNLQQKTIEKNGKKFLKVVSKGQEHHIEILALKEIVEQLKEERSLRFILMGKRPNPEQAGEERFFNQLKGNVKAKYSLVLRLYDFVKQKEEFEVRWGCGRHWFTLNFHVKKWNVAPINIEGNGRVWIGYAGNPAISPWELPNETQEKLRPMFNHDKPKRGKQVLPKWAAVPLKNYEDLDKIKKAIEILAEDSKKYSLLWKR